MKRPFTSWTVGAPYYLPLLLAAGILIAVGGAMLKPGVVFLLLGLFALNFFRDPPRRIPTEPGAVVSPADGVVTAIEDMAETEHYVGPCRRVSIFLNVFNVHINRCPADAGVVDIRYKKGKYLNAMNPESSRVNESNAIWLDSVHGPMTVRQVSGAIARRIVCMTTPGECLVRGEKFGMIKFGSRTELYLPPGTEVCVRVGEKVRGGSTTVARAR